MELSPQAQEHVDRLRLEKEIQRVREMIPQLVPFEGALPKTIEEFNRLPEPWRREIALKNQGYIEDLAARARIVEQLAAQERARARLSKLLADAPVKSLAEFNALAPAKRQQVVQQLTQEQRDALIGVERPAAEEGWL